MNKPLLLRSVVVFAFANLLCGCASIISGRHAEVTLDSSPSAAQVVIRDKHGKQVLTTHTPATVQLKRKDKFIWPAKYTATFEKPGYTPKTVKINSTVNPWVFGNVVIGGPIGLVVDNATGAAWQPKVASIDASLEPQQLAYEPPPTGYDQMPLPPAGIQSPEGMPGSVPQLGVQPASGTMYR